MSSKASKSLIGAFVIGAVALGTIAVMVFGGGRLFEKKNKIIMFFDGSVKGLDTGAPIVFRGVKLGQVTEIFIEARAEDLKVRIPVFGEIYEGRVRRWGEDIAQQADPERYWPILIDKGLRAQLQMQSLVTGKLQINLDYFPDTDPRFVKKRRLEDFFEVPTIQSQLDKFRQTFENLPIGEIFAKLSRTLDGIEKVVNDPDIMETVRDVRAAVADARKLLNNADGWVGTIGSNAHEWIAAVGEGAHQTLGDIQGLVKNADAQIDPLAKNANSAMKAAKRAFRQGEKTLAFKGGKPEKIADSFTGAADAFRDTLIAAKPAVVKAEAAIENIRSITDKDSPDRRHFNNMLRELSAAARSIRQWADYLERHPEALLRGKGGTTRR